MSASNARQLPPEFAAPEVQDLLRRGRLSGQVTVDDVRRTTEQAGIPMDRMKAVLRSFSREGVTVVVAADEAAQPGRPQRARSHRARSGGQPDRQGVAPQQVAPQQVAPQQTVAASSRRSVVAAALPAGLDVVASDAALDTTGVDEAAEPVRISRRDRSPRRPSRRRTQTAAGQPSDDTAPAGADDADRGGSRGSRPAPRARRAKGRSSEGTTRGRAAPQSPERPAADAVDAVDADADIDDGDLRGVQGVEDVRGEPPIEVAVGAVDGAADEETTDGADDVDIVGSGEDEGFVLDLDDDDSPAQQVATAGATADPVKDYLKQIGKVALLNAEQEVELAKRIEAGLFAEEKLNSGEKLNPRVRKELEWIAEDGRRAKNHLLEANLRLVVSLAKRYTGRGCSSSI